MSRSPTPRLLLLLSLALVVPLWSGCGPTEPIDKPDTEEPDAGEPDTGEPDAGEPDAGEPDAGEPDPFVEHVRKVVIARPWPKAGFDCVPVWEVLDLLEDGTLVWPKPRVTFEMGVGSEGNVVFTPDGKYGIASQKDGFIGIFTFDEDGKPRVIKAAWRGPNDDFYSSGVVMDPSGKRFYVIDHNWANNGGGVYSVRLEASGEPVLEGKVFSAKLGSQLGFLPNQPGEVLYHSIETLDAPANTDFHRLKWGGIPTRLTSVSAFSAGNNSVSAMAISPDGAWVLLSDSPFTEGQSGRVAVVSIAQDSPELQVIHHVEGVKNPSGLAWSPYGNVAIALENFGDEVKVLPFDTSKPEEPLSFQGSMTYSSEARALPHTIHVIDQGNLRGLTLISELRGIRKIQFHPDGTVEDLGLIPLIEGLEGNEIIVRTMGVQP